ncbi:hypothetical protein C823_002560 [Eubacterium plexicaudatum ASF492]|uniref:Stage II sporulation protein P n=1 Tax=Eubacterium plexicaudatum ASF492 TaxID=1235802 RepID=N2AE45_9FIRM|nr:hypothetical protein C823_002560 [Eubacterium plexicaudatum ASF492]
MHFKKKYKKKWWAGTFPLFVFVVSGIYVMDSARITQHTILDAVSQAVRSNLGYQAVRSCMPLLVYDATSSDQKTIYEYLTDSMDDMLPIYGYTMEREDQMTVGSLGLPGEEDSCGSYQEAGAWDTQLPAREDEQAPEKEQVDLQGTKDTTDASVSESNNRSALATGEKVKKFSRQKLNDFDYLLQNFYRVDSTTTTNSKQLNAAKMLAKDMRIDAKQEGPQILIYHTHSQERFADSKNADQSVVGLGDTLADILEQTYGYRVLHHKGKYDIPDRDNAYSRAAPALEQILKENPGIQVVIDLHRDGVAEQTRLVEKVNGKDTATIMFFNGLSHTTAQGDISYLYNPNLADNLAFSFQLQLAAAEYYPGFSRFIYLKGYRYNLHYLPKSLLVEVGAQTNTYEEALNAMEPLADVLDRVLGR